MNYVLSALETKGYVERKAAKGRRARTIILTEEGRNCSALFANAPPTPSASGPSTSALRASKQYALSLHELAAWLGTLEAPANDEA
jgi:DNA-binding MarR family transcriptional regulator